MDQGKYTLTQPKDFLLTEYLKEGRQTGRQLASELLYLLQSSALHVFIKQKFCHCNHSLFSVLLNIKEKIYTKGFGINKNFPAQEACLSGDL